MRLLLLLPLCALSKGEQTTELLARVGKRRLALLVLLWESRLVLKLKLGLVRCMGVVLLMQMRRHMGILGRDTLDTRSTRALLNLLNWKIGAILWREL